VTLHRQVRAGRSVVEVALPDNAVGRGGSSAASTPSEELYPDVLGAGRGGVEPSSCSESQDDHHDEREIADHESGGGEPATALS